MSLLALQNTLARLYTDSAFRARFFEDPAGAGAEMGLTAAEQRQAAGLDRRQVERFALSLRQKRLGLARELLPGTARVLGERFRELFFHYCDSQPSAPERVEEAKAFVGYLLEALAETSPYAEEALGYMPECGRESATGSGTPAQPEADWCPHSGKLCAADPEPPPGYLGDLLACERLRLEVLYPAGGAGGSSTDTVSPSRSLATLSDAFPRLTPSARVGRFQHDVEALYPSILRGETVEARPEPCFILIGKLRGAMRVRLKRINAATAELLTLCDGTRPLAAIVDEVAAGLRLNAVDRQSFEAECARLLAPLVESELIEIHAQNST
jgi:hypothetical protein